MSLRAIALVWSGVRRCLVSGTSFPLMRARKTSPALMWRSDAPRSTAALMIFSMSAHGDRWLDNCNCEPQRHRGTEGSPDKRSSALPPTKDVFAVERAETGLLEEPLCLCASVVR